MNTLITGSSGFIGSHLKKLFPSAYECDLKQGRDYVEIRPDDYDVIIHCAALVSVPESIKVPYRYFIENEYKLQYLLNKGFKGKFVFLSTCALYGENKNAREDHANILNCSNPYSYSKFIGEQIVRLHCKEPLILRLGNVIGQGQDERGEANCMTHFSKDIPIVVYGGDQTRDFVEVETVCNAIKNGIEKNITGTFNIGSGVATKVLNKAVEEGNRRGIPISFQPERAGEIKNISLNISKAMEAGLYD